MIRFSTLNRPVLLCLGLLLTGCASYYEQAPVGQVLSDEDRASLRNSVVDAFNSTPTTYTNPLRERAERARAQRIAAYEEAQRFRENRSAGPYYAPTDEERRQGQFTPFVLEPYACPVLDSDRLVAYFQISEESARSEQHSDTIVNKYRDMAAYLLDPSFMRRLTDGINNTAFAELNLAESEEWACIGLVLQKAQQQDSEDRINGPADSDALSPLYDADPDERFSLLAHLLIVNDSLLSLRARAFEAEPVTAGQVFNNYVLFLLEGIEGHLPRTLQSKRVRGYMDDNPLTLNGAFPITDDLVPPAPQTTLPNNPAPS